MYRSIREDAINGSSPRSTRFDTVCGRLSNSSEAGVASPIYSAVLLQELYFFTLTMAFVSLILTWKVTFDRIHEKCPRMSGGSKTHLSA